MNKCEICGSTKNVYRYKGGIRLCGAHHYQMKKYGEILNRTIYTPNEIVIKDGHAEIIIYGKNNNEKCRAIIDIEDIDKVKKYKWGISSTGYVMNTKFGILLHRYLVNTPNNIYVDHRELNPLDNRKKNLRMCTKSQNGCNRGLPTNNTSGIKGVSYDKQTRTWRAYIGINGRTLKLGRYKNIEKAKQVRIAAAKRYHGEFAREA